MNACPECGAAVREDAPWCTLCFHDLRAQPEPAAELVAAAAVTSGRHAAEASSPAVDDDAAEPDDGDRDDADGDPHAPVATWPCSRCGTDNEISETMCTSCGAGFLAEIAEQGGVHLNLPVIGDLTRLPKPVMYLLALGVAVLFALLVGGLATVL